MVDRRRYHRVMSAHYGFDYMGLAGLFRAANRLTTPGCWSQRTQMPLADGSWWVYRYDDLGQVISGRRFWADGTPVAGQFTP